MEETLGKRIVANRKRLGLTQDALAEQLGVTAQAVSKWENDQSCPDITMLPRLAQVFCITTDALLGLEAPQTHVAEMDSKTNEESAPDTPGIRMQSEDGTWELQWDGGRKSGIAIGIWVLSVGGLLLYSALTEQNISLLNLLWPSGLLVFGLFGIWPKFSVLRLGCGLFGAYCLLEIFHLAPFGLELGVILPLFLLLVGAHLVTQAFRKPQKGTFSVAKDGNPIASSVGNHCTYSGEFFDCATGFGENHYVIQMPRLSGGRAETGFGEMTVDLCGCEELAKGCHLELKCGFGELTLLVPRKWKVVPDSSTSFGNVDIQGSADPDTEGVITVNCSVSFGDITIRYL